MFNFSKIPYYLGKKGLLNWMPDKAYLKLVYRCRMGKSLDLENPKTFNEKLQWLKLYNRQPQYSMMVDKYEVKQYVAGIIGEEHIIPTLGVWDRFEDIDFEKLPDQFVLKCTHDSGGIVICKDKSHLNINDLKKKIKSSLRHNYYYDGREWPYKNVPPRIIAEKYMADHSDQALKDYKLMCFNGTHKCSFTCTERFSNEGLKVTFFDKDWNRMPFERHYPASNVEIEKPENYDEMVSMAEKISRDIPFARIDFYEIDGKVYFGEITLFPGNGFEEFDPIEWDYTFGEWIELPNDRRMQ